MAVAMSSRARVSPVSREIAYRGRYAWVSFKETVGMSRRNDRTFYVDRFVRALQTGVLPRTYGVLATGKDDGAGSQAQAAMSAICLAHAFGLEYIHRPFTLVEHAEGPMGNWVRQCEDYFNLGAGARTLAERPGPVVPLDEFMMAPQKWPQDAIVAAPHYLHYCNQAPQAWEQARPLLRAKYRENKTLRRTADFTIAMHVRRGDVSADTNNKARSNFTPNAAFLRTLDRLRDAVETRVPSVRIRALLARRPGDLCRFRAGRLRAQSRYARPCNARRAGRSRCPHHLEGCVQLHRRRAERRDHAL